jgi:hypothetical protein
MRAITKRMAIACFAALACLLASMQALAHSRTNVQFGFVFGPPAPAYYYPPYPRYYYPPAAPVYYQPAVAVPAAPPVYIERGNAAPSAAPQDHWYYCPDARAYYPYVKECPGGWQRMVPDAVPR